MKKYFQETFAELNNVTWPTQKRGTKITIIVFIFMILSAAALGLVDFLFSLLIESLVSLSN